MGWTYDPDTWEPLHERRAARPQYPLGQSIAWLTAIALCLIVWAAVGYAIYLLVT